MAFSKSVVKAQAILLCQLCEADSNIKWKCVECQLLMCTKCRDRVHPKFKHADEHEVLNLKEIKPQGEGGGHKLDFTRIRCKQHQGQVCCLFCSSCDKLVCPGCVSKSHTGHKFSEVNEAYGLKIEHLKNSKGKLEKEKADLTKEVQKLDNLKTIEDSECRGVIHEIQRQRAVLKHEVDRNADNLIKEVEQKLGKIQDYISGEKMKVEKTIKHLKDQSKMAESLINTTDVSNFFDEVNKIDQMLEEDVPPVNLIHKSTPKFVPGDKSLTTVGLIQDKIKTTDIRRQITVTKEFSEEPQITTTNMLKVTDLPSGTTEDSLEFFFENTGKFGGGDVEEIDYDEETSTAIITFKEDDVVEKVLQKMSILFRKKIIEVEAYTANVEPPLDITGKKILRKYRGSTQTRGHTYH